MIGDTQNKLQIKNASNAAFASILNLTLLPVIGFVALIIIYKKTTSNNIDHYHAILGMKINIIACIVTTKILQLAKILKPVVVLIDTTINSIAG